MFEFLKTLFGRPQSAPEKQGQPPAVDRQGVASAAVNDSPQQAIFDIQLVDKLEPKPDEHFMTPLEAKTEIAVADTTGTEKSGATQGLETPKWMGKETPAPEPEVAAAGSANTKRSGKASKLSLAETTTVTTPAPKPKSHRTTPTKTAAVKTKAKAGSKKAGGISETKKKAADLKPAPAKPKT